MIENEAKKALTKMAEILYTPTIMNYLHMTTPRAPPPAGGASRTCLLIQLEGRAGQVCLMKSSECFRSVVSKDHEINCLFGQPEQLEQLEQLGQPR